MIRHERSYGYGVPPDASGVDNRAEQLAVVADTALSQFDLERTLGDLLARVRELLAADTAVILLMDDDADELRAAAAVGLEEEVRQGVRIPIGAGFAGRVAAERKPIHLRHVDRSNVVNPLLWEKGLTSMLGVPLLTDDRMVGVLHVGSLAQREFSDNDVHVLQLAADWTALTTRAQMMAIDRAAAAALQRSLLPPRLPHVPGFELAARYVPGSRTGVGGDWYDVFGLLDGRWGVAIGDVAGHGLGAATVMGRVRSALRAYAIESADPADTLARLSRNIFHFESSGMATVGYAVLDAAHGRVSLSSAGHLPPLLATPHGSTAPVKIAVDPPLHADLRPTARRTVTVDLEPGAVLVSFTDGLIERRGESIDHGIHRLCQLVTPDHPEAVCARIMADLVGSETPDDDIAVLVLRRMP